jgi:hypothetical protein
MCSKYTGGDRIVTISAIPYAVLTLIIVGLLLVGLGPVIDDLIDVNNDNQAMDFPYSVQRGETLGFLLMCWGALGVSAVLCVVIFLIMNGAQRGTGGI